MREFSEHQKAAMAAEMNMGLSKQEIKIIYDHILKLERRIEKHEGYYPQSKCKMDDVMDKMQDIVKG